MKTVFYIFLMFIPTVLVSDTTVSNEYRILQAGGCFHGNEVKPVENKNWFGLYKTEEGFELQSVIVSSSPCHDIVIDEHGDTTGISITINSDNQPIVLLQGDIFKSGPILDASDKQVQLSPGVSHQLQNTKGHSYLYVTGEFSDEGGRRHYSDLLITDYQLTLVSANGDFIQRLVSYERMGMDGVPRIFWSGDIDRDGKTDFLLDITNHYNVSHLALYLSSKADDGKIVKLVAELRTTGC